ncbi:MFS general substrate transporter [Exidia glandulosa HHB12029]|uniref:MFS general substrate transporter n=1 Tax=Exidia glandulosa HHB12029 TaxID=1314781 RepID=A0A165LSI6_EXIGL|nr:MFS general substrate transporter [Exidia glandulosa HHB12029]
MSEENEKRFDAEHQHHEKASSQTGTPVQDSNVNGRRGEERRLLVKQDALILPLTALLYLSAYLDRGNVGNARLQGLQATVLGGSDTKFSIVLMCFYITYITFSIPGTLLAKAIMPSLSIAMGCFIWSVAAASMAGTTNFASVVVCRLFIGIGEGINAVALYYSMWYKKDEISKRLALFIGAGVLSGAFGGLIAYGVAHIHHPAIASWRILFLIEGIPSFVLAICVVLFLPSRPSSSRYLSPAQRELAMTRLDEDSLGGEAHNGIDWTGVKRALTCPWSYVLSVAYSCMNCTLGSVSGFLPTIIKTMGYSNADAQLFTVPPYAVALVFMTLTSTASDKVRSRGPFVALVFSLSALGWLILLVVETNQRARYFATFLTVIGGYAAIPLIMSWVSNNTGSESQRATSLGMLNSVGQCLSIAASFLFPSSEGPGWKKGFGTNLALNLLAVVLALGLSAYFRRENKRRDEVEGGQPIDGKVLDVVRMHDLAPGFRYTP